MDSCVELDNCSFDIKEARLKEGCPRGVMGKALRPEQIQLLFVVGYIL